MGRIPARLSSASFCPASPPISAGGKASTTEGRAPWRLSHRATTKPSPALPPLPQTTTTRAPRSGAPSPGSAAAIASAAPRPAFSMRVAPGMPSSVIARRSSRRISAAVKTPCTGLPSGGQRDRLGEEVGEDRGVGLPPLRARAPRQLDVERAPCQRQDAVTLRARRGVADGVGGLDEHGEARRLAIHPQVSVADQLEEGAQLERLVTVDADGRDLDPVGGVSIVVPVDLGVEAERALGGVTNLSFIDLVHLSRTIGGSVLGRRASRHAPVRSVDLVAPP